MEFFKLLHWNEVLVIMASHFIINIKNEGFMKMMKAICVHLFIGEILTCLTELIVGMVGPVGSGGEFAN